MTRTTWVRTIVEDPDNPGEFLLDLGPELVEHLGWKEGDQLEWQKNDDGTWTITKPKTTGTPC